MKRKGPLRSFVLITLLGVFLATWISPAYAADYQLKKLWRLYNGKDHMYTAWNTYRMTAMQYWGYVDEDHIGRVFHTDDYFQFEMPLYHLVSRKNGDHMLTIDIFEVDKLTENGRPDAEWKYLRREGFVFPGDTDYRHAPLSGGVPVYRLWGPTLQDHFYTNNKDEAFGARGYVVEFRGYPYFWVK